MRLLPILLALPLLALQAHLQTAAAQQTATAPASPTMGAPAPAASDPGATARHRMTWQQHFAQANLAHDGHLTLGEASGGYPTVARHFKEIDADKKGYVTEEDITNWHKLQRAMRHTNQGRTDGDLRPRPAFHEGLSTPQPINTSTGDKMLPMTQPDAPAAGQQATTK
jgi:hypothetical protein